MPTYEMPILMRIMSKTNTAKVLKRTAETIFEKGGFIRKIEYLGRKRTPYKIRANEQYHREASVFVFSFDAPPSALLDVTDEYGRDVDIMTKNIFKKTKPVKEECTLHEETLPPPYRKSVQEMVRLAEEQDKKETKYHWKFNHGLDYYPFQR